MIPPLIFEDDNQEPGLHALIIGVSAYSHLQGGTSKPEDEPMLSLYTSLRQLSGPAKSAKDIADFLIERKGKLVKPLRTLRFLASPSTAEVGPAFEGVKPATTENVKSALTAWRRDARRSDDEVTFFYFSGHGSQLSQTNAVLLLADYLGGQAVLDRTIEVNDIYGGMGASDAVKTIARTQFYFIDACRVGEEVFSKIKPKGACLPWDVFDTGPARRKAAPIFFAALAGEQTKTFVEENTTRFGRRLLNCLRSGGAEQTGSNKWVVTIGHLAQALSRLSVLQNLTAGATVDTFEVNGWGQDRTVIHELDGPPKVPCTFRFNPSDARKGIGLVLDNFTPVPLKFPPELKDPHCAEIVAGMYRMSSMPDNLLSAEPINLEPPSMEITIEPGRISWI